jgi:hypothetical protein
MELIRDYALPLPMTIITEILGVPIAVPRCFWLKENTQRWLLIASGILQSQ